MTAQAGLCLAWSETPEDTFCRVVAQIKEKTYFSPYPNAFVGLVVHKKMLMVLSNCTDSFNVLYCDSTELDTGQAT